MGTGIVVCGMNGAGKSTLGKALAGKLNFHFIDNEDLVFPKTDANDPYARERTREEAKRRLLLEIGAHEDFVFACVRNSYGEEIDRFFAHAVLIDVPKDVRLQRVRDRSFRRFGDRMMPGGDLHEREEAFFELVKSRPEGMAEAWARTLKCPVIRVDGTRDVRENVALIVGRLRR